MNIFEVIDGIFELILSWRFYLCVLIGLGLGALILSSVPHQIVAWVLASLVFLCCFVAGWRWDNSAN